MSIKQNIDSLTKKYIEIILDSLSDNYFTVNDTTILSFLSKQPIKTSKNVIFIIIS
jgi:hypothetical protein